MRKIISFTDSWYWQSFDKAFNHISKRKLNVSGSFRRGILSHAHAPAHMQKHLEVPQIAQTNQTFDCTLWLLNCLYLIKISVHSHVAINADGCHWLLKWTYINKYFDCESCWFYIEIKKVFTRSLQGFKVYICNFFQNLYKEWIEGIQCILDKGKTVKNEWENDYSNFSLSFLQCM